jgi:predicted regulator of Ras-like GTPase activity (Roadblock/LC7/MglB family)
MTAVEESNVRSTSQLVSDAVRQFRSQVPDCIASGLVAGVDGLLILHDTMAGAEPHDIAALAADAHGISRTCGAALGQGTFSEVTIRNSGGYLAVYCKESQRRDDARATSSGVNDSCWCRWSGLVASSRTSWAAARPSS